MPDGIYSINNLVIYPNMNEGDNNPFITPNAPLKGALSHQPRATPWGNRNVTIGAPYRGKRRYIMLILRVIDIVGIKKNIKERC